MKNIRFTLLKSLFFDTPPYMGDLLAENANRVFPGRDDFIRFLEETDSQKRTQQAACLLMRLSRESGLFVPARLLISLLQVEEQYAPSTVSDTYVPQDHFVHLINLYLLGIYVFTHHKKLNRILSSYFERRRQERLHTCSLNSDEASFGDFIFSWRAFVLLHDIAYPNELPPLPDNPLLSEIRSRYSSFIDEVADETAISFLSRMAAWHLADDFSSPITCESVAIGLFSKKQEHKSDLLFPEMNKDEKDKDIDSWRSSVRLPILHGRRFLTLCKHVCPQERILAILIHSRSGKVSLALIPDGKGGHTLRNIENKLKLSLPELIRHAFELGTTPRLSSRNAEYEWQLFVLDYNKDKSLFVDELKKIVNRDLNAELISHVSKKLANDAPATIATITSDGDLRTYEHWIHEKLQMWWHGIRQGTKIEATTEHSVVTSIAQSLEQNIAARISMQLKKRIEDTLSAAQNGNTGEVLSSGLFEIVKKAISPILNNSKLIDEIAFSLREELQSKIEQELSRRKLVDDLRRIARQLLPGTQPELSYKSSNFDWRDVLATVKEEEKLINEFLKESGLPPLSDLLENYNPEYLKEKCLDHGLASALFTLQISNAASSFANMLQQSSNKTSDNKIAALARFASIALCLGDETSEDDLSYRVSILLAEVGRTVAVHNLYPKHMEPIGHAEFRVNLKREPFCFFAMLVDALQCWDRDRRLWQGNSNLPYKTAGDNYDVSIRGDVIHVHEHDHGLDIGRRADAIRNGLETYMKGASSFITLDLAQWKDGTQQLSPPSPSH